MSLRDLLFGLPNEDGSATTVKGGGPKPVPLRGRVSKVSIVRGGAVSVHVTFGIDEPLARMLDQGSLVELLEIQKAPRKVPKPKPGDVLECES